MTKKFAIVLALALIAIVCCAGCILPSGPVDPVDPVDPITPPVEPVVPEEPEDPVVPEEPVDPVVPAEGDFTVTFMMNSAVDSSVYLTVYVDEGESVAEPEVPEKPTAQYIFVKWTTDKENRNAYDFATPVTADLVLYADWDVMGVSSGSHTHNYVEGEKDGKQGLLCSCGSFKPYLVEINGESYTSVDEAITNAEAGETITLVTAPETPINVGDADVTIEISSDVDATTTPVSLTYAEDTEIKIKADSPEKVEVTITDSDAGTEKKVVFDDTPADDGLLVPIAAVDEDSQVGDAYNAAGFTHLLEMISGSSSGPLAAPAEDAPTEHVQDGWNVLFYEPAPTALGEEVVSVPEWTITLKADIDEPVEITVPVIIDGNGFAATLEYDDFKLIHVLQKGSEKITVLLNGEAVDFDEKANDADCLVVKSVTKTGGNLDIYSLEGLKEFRDAVNAVNGGNAFSGKTVTLMNEIDLSSEENWTPIGIYPDNLFSGTFNGQEIEISGMTISKEDGSCVGLFGAVSGATIQNVKVIDAELSGDHYVGTIVGWASKSRIEKCIVTDAEITVHPYPYSQSEEKNGDKVGGIVGWIGGTTTVTECTVTDAKITAYRDVGGIVGAATKDLCAENSPNVITSNSVSGTSITVDQTTGYYEDKDFNAAAILGRDASAVSGLPSTISDNAGTADITYMVKTIGGIQTALDAASGETTIKLGDDITVTKTLEIADGKTITLDLNRHNIFSEVSNDGKAASIITVNRYGTLTITGIGKLSFKASDPDLQEIPSYATNTITCEGTLTIKKGVTVENYSDGGASYAVDAKGKFTLDGGTLIGDRCALRIAKYNQDNVQFTMESGLVQAKTPAWIQLPGSNANDVPTITVTINGGTFLSTNKNPDADVMYTSSFGNSHANTAITINGGSFLGGTVSIGSGYKGDAPALTINDGTFDHDVLQWLENDESKVLYQKNLNQ